jgi:hypothetical protein
MGLSTISLGMSVSQENGEKERKFIWPNNIFRQSCFCMNNKTENKEEVHWSWSNNGGRNLEHVFGAED